MPQCEPEKNLTQTSEHPFSFFAPLKAHLSFWPIVIVGLVFDLWSKKTVFQYLQEKPTGQLNLINGFLQFIRTENAGAAFSMASGHTTFLITISIVALIVVVAIFIFGQIRYKLMHIGLALFTAGILGNLYDRTFNDGLVRDFIDVYYGKYHWPAFNVADSMLCIAVALLLFSNITSASSQKPAQKQK